MFKSVPVTVSLVMSFSALSVHAAPSPQDTSPQEAGSQQTSFAAQPASSETALNLDKVYITGGADELRTLPGSATLIDEEALEAFEYTDIHRVLNAVPGVNLQEEDGYGLRPNIGLRGTSPERSKKVTLMEDGVLSGPAPYSAPAAYYFPSVSRMSAVEVFKGPATTQYGPATIGGAVNLVSRPIPYAAEGELDVQQGSYNFQRDSAYYGQQVGDFGYLIEGLRVSTDGFKKLDDSGHGSAKDDNTGFSRRDISLKTSWQSLGEYSQLFQLKLGYADEDSNETYLGLSKDDFDADPFRRYAASQLDNMQWDHQQFQFTHSIELSDALSVNTDVYRNTFKRDWFKVNGFNVASTDTTLQDVLLNPARSNNPDFYKVLTGERSSSNSQEQLRIGNNGRQYISEGVQSRVNWLTDSPRYSNELEVGIRYHQDQIKRNHTEQLYKMLAGKLVAQGTRDNTRINKGEAKALALYVKDELRIGETTLTLGLRSEQINTSQTTIVGNPVGKVSSNESVLLPGLGVYSQLTPSLGVLAGVHQGYSATAPGNDGELEPEQSTNYEAGLRFHDDGSGVNWGQGELIAFFNDYSQLSATCTASNGCDNAVIDSQANAGAAQVYGVESSYKITPEYGAYRLPIQLSYTYTQAKFAADYYDKNGAFGDKKNDIFKDDELAYVPEHRLNAQLGVQHDSWKINLSALYQSDMRSTPGQGTIAANERIDGYVVVDVAASVQLLSALQLYSTLDNVLGKDYVVASKPYGYRPGKPQSLNVGLKYQF